MMEANEFNEKVVKELVNKSEYMFEQSADYEYACGYQQGFLDCLDQIKEILVASN